MEKQREQNEAEDQKRRTAGQGGVQEEGESKSKSKRKT